MWFEVNYNKLVWQWFPVQLRKAALVQITYCYMRPLIQRHYWWKQYRESNIYKLSHNGQICYLRKALNDTFDQDLRRIYIDGTGGDATKTYIYTDAENQPKYLGTIYLRGSLEFQDTGADFIVYVPASIMATQNYEVRALIDFYKLGGKRYLIIEI